MQCLRYNINLYARVQKRARINQNSVSELSCVHPVQCSAVQSKAFAGNQIRSQSESKIRPQVECLWLYLGYPFEFVFIFVSLVVFVFVFTKVSVRMQRQSKSQLSHRV